MGRLLLALRSFFGILFQGGLSDRVLAALGLARPAPQAPAPAEPPPASASDGALQILSILQRDARLIDFLMEDISGYEDEQVGAAVRTLHDQCRQSLLRYVQLAPVIDGVEGTFTSLGSRAAGDAAKVKFLGNVPAEPPKGGVLRHKGWRAEQVDLPPIVPQQDVSVIAPAEIEVE